MLTSFVHKPKIFITGCSWAHGEWGEGSQQYTVVHEGIIHYFREKGYNVLFSGKGGASNKIALVRLTEDLNKYYSPGDIILFIQTDPTRDCDKEKSFEITNNIIRYNGYINWTRSLLEEFYVNANKLAKNFNTNINLIGGLYNLLPYSIFIKYSNLIPLVESWVNLLVKDSIEIGISDTTFTIKNISLDVMRKDLALRVVDEMYKLDYNRNVWAIDEYFKPDNKHPNRKGHRVLFEYIVDKLKL